MAEQETLEAAEARARNRESMEKCLRDLTAVRGQSILILTTVANLLRNVETTVERVEKVLGVRGREGPRFARVSIEWVEDPEDAGSTDAPEEQSEPVT